METLLLPGKKNAIGAVVSTFLTVGSNRHERLAAITDNFKSTRAAKKIFSGVSMYRIRHPQQVSFPTPDK